METRKESYGTVALLEKEMEQARVIQEIEEVDAFIAAINSKRTALAELSTSLLPSSVEAELSVTLRFLIGNEKRLRNCYPS
ncbi:MAG: hypothetical protein IM568_07605 [Flavobacterium sp.]|nr:hypothetical protein [Flavobacterium sp.]